MSDDLTEDLSRFIGDDDPDFEADPVAAESLEQASRWLRKIAVMDRKRAEVSRLADAERSRIAEWELEQTLPILKQREWLERSCLLLAAALRARDPRTASWSTPNGTLKTTRQQPEWVWDDPETATKWLLEYRPDLLADEKPAPARVPDKNAVKKAAELPAKHAVGDEVTPMVDAGEVFAELPGVRVVFRDVKCEIELP